MKAVKIILGLVIAVALVVGIVVFLGLKNINAIVKRTVESVGPQVTQTNVTLEKVDIDITRGRGELNHLMIANPAGFNSDYAVRLGQIVLEIEPQTLLNPVIVIKEMRVGGVKLIAEQKDMVNSNLQQLLKSVQSKTGGGSTGDSTTSDSAGSAAAPDSGSEIRMMVEKLVFAGSSVQIITEQWGEHTLDLPDIEVDGIGDRETGLTPNQLGQAILKPVLEQAKAKVKRDLKQRVGKKAEAKLKQKLEDKLDDKQKEKLEALKQLLRQ
ncbi:MAG: hypothetical protein P8Y45_01165 [Exilibacterium sp.]